ncbi:serine/threonine-protein phosphatase 2A activator [Nematocida sp. AWRm77]|nr:serine/threonine-protein phosphatase 2A activator [Nematocida sp. AWRm77]
MKDLLYNTDPGNADVEKFKSSLAYKHITQYLKLLDEKVKENEIEGDTKACFDIGSLQGVSEEPIHAVLGEISKILDAVPLEKEDQRYGNKGFVNFMERIEKEGEGIIRRAFFQNKASKTTEALHAYLKGSFGNARRIDYGTGHELHFFCFLIVLHLQERIELGSMFKALEHYFSIVRMLLLKYRLEPAGSYGDFGIDDYQLLPFLFGTSQFCKRNDLVFSSLFEKQNSGLCFVKAVRFVYVHKKYPAIKHSYEEKVEKYRTAEISKDDMMNSSPMIATLQTVSFNILNKGMFKMYDNTVLSKRVVIQHFISSEFLPV